MTTLVSQSAPPQLSPQPALPPPSSARCLVGLPHDTSLHFTSPHHATQRYKSTAPAALCRTSSHVLVLRYTYFRRKPSHTKTPYLVSRRLPVCLSYRTVCSSVPSSSEISNPHPKPAQKSPLDAVRPTGSISYCSFLQRTPASTPSHPQSVCSSCRPKLRPLRSLRY